jgi:hypothetical protein
MLGFLKTSHLYYLLLFVNFLRKKSNVHFRGLLGSNQDRQ